MENICEKNYGIGRIILNKSINIFVLNWNGLHIINECLDSLMNISYINSTIIVIDNGSKDASVSFISKKYPKVKIVELENNLGYAEGNNKGFGLIKKADYSIFINNDTVVDPSFVEPLVNTLESDEKIMQVSPKILYHHQKIPYGMLVVKSICQSDIFDIMIFEKKIFQYFHFHQKQIMLLAVAFVCDQMISMKLEDLIILFLCIVKMLICH